MLTRRWRPDEEDETADGVRITKRVVDAALPRPGRYTIFDSAIPGFGLRVFPTGAKSWIFEYRPGAGGQGVDKKRVTIGKATEITPDQARKAADQLRAGVIRGEDPMGMKAAQRAAPTVADLAKAFLTDHVTDKRESSTYIHYKDLLDRIILPEVGKVKAIELDHAEVAKLHRAWKKTPFQANRILAVISSMYGYGARQPVKMVPKGTNPAADIEKYDGPARNRPLKPDELMSLGDALRLAETTGIPWEVRAEKRASKHLAAPSRQVTVHSEHVIAAIRLLMFTGARLREILNLEWDQVDLDAGMLLLDHHKTKRRTGQIKPIVLNPPAIEVLSKLTRIGKFVIAGEAAGTPEEKPRPDIKKPWASISKHAGLEGLRINDLRHNFASLGVGGGMGLPIVGKLLGHTQVRTTERILRGVRAGSARVGTPIRRH
jgi:integrase